MGNYDDEVRLAARDSLFNKRVNGVRRTNTNMQAFKSTHLPNVGQSAPAPKVSAADYQSGTFRSNAAQHAFPEQANDPFQTVVPQRPTDHGQSGSAYEAYLAGLNYPAAPAPAPAPAPAQQPSYQSATFPAPALHAQTKSSALGGAPVEHLTDEELDQRALFDAQTRTHNLRHLVRVLEYETKRAVTYNRPLSVLAVAVPNLRQLEHLGGPFALNLVLRTIGQTLLRSCGPIDIVGRYTDDRFIVVCPEMSLENATALAHKLNQEFLALVVPVKALPNMAASIGIASISDLCTDVESLIAIADLGADMVIQQGGNSCCYAPLAI